MSAAKIGRNDRCPCGSGKKYKHCHWRQDQERPAVTAAPPAATVPSPLDFADLRRQMQALSQHIPGADHAEVARLMSTVELLADYQLHHEEIEAAHEALEAHHAEFAALLKDETAAAEQARRLFAEEKFAPLRFRATDIRRAFAAVGYPGLVADRKTLETLRQAILFLADADHRRVFTTKLLLGLPEYVTAGRPLDACLLRLCAMLTSEENGESNPFLYEMFHHGLVEWEAQRRDQDGELLRQMGLDVEQIRELPPEELERRLNEIASDPQRLKHMESFVQANPDVRAALETQCASADTLSIALLDREDAGPLFPTPSETLPWLEIFQQRIMANDALVAVLKGEPPPDNAVNALGELMWAVAGEMAAAIFTPARVTQLKTQLREFAAQHRDAGDPDGQDQAEAALLVLVRGPETGDKHFLTSVCYTALRDTLRTAGGSPAETPAP